MYRGARLNMRNDTPIVNSVQLEFCVKHKTLTVHCAQQTVIVRLFNLNPYTLIAGFPKI